MFSGRTIKNLSDDEYRVAMDAILEVRKEAVKNAYFEGWSAGFKASRKFQDSGLIGFSGIHEDWNESHAKTVEKELRK